MHAAQTPLLAHTPLVARGRIARAVYVLGNEGGVAAELYSGSADRTARVWDLAQRGYVETLYGHQEGVTALDALGEQVG